MKKYLLLVLLIFIGINQYGFDNFFPNDEKESINKLASVTTYSHCNNCDPGMFWNDFMQRCERIPGWVPKDDKRDKGYNLLPYGPQDINKSHDDVVKHNAHPAPIEDDIESTSSEDDTDTNTNSSEDDTNSTPSEEYNEEDDIGW